ncbi:MAG TPA: tryptophan synthase subunit alpha [Holophaga sp.]|nr:tryptophan synthase subunit alpha [Holophaga sp.]
MSLQELLKERTASGRKLLVPYLCAGFPPEADTLRLLEGLEEGGADVIELGIPFSDPLLDGPVIQAASQRALAGGMTLSRALGIARTFTAHHRTPLVVMSSFNPLLRMGPEVFARRAREAGIAGCIIPDLPPEAQYLLPGAPPLVQLAAPNTPEERIRDLAAQRPPFIYCVSVFGVTGARDTLADYTLPFLRRVRKQADVPCLAGFGVSTPEQAQEMAEACDGVIVGSALLRVLEACAGPREMKERARRFAASFRKALDEARAAVAPCS